MKTKNETEKENPRRKFLKKGLLATLVSIPMALGLGSLMGTKNDMGLQATSSSTSSTTTQTQGSITFIDPVTGNEWIVSVKNPTNLLDGDNNGTSIPVNPLCIDNQFNKTGFAWSGGQFQNGQVLAMGQKRLAGNGLVMIRKNPVQLLNQSTPILDLQHWTFVTTIQFIVAELNVLSLTGEIMLAINYTDETGQVVTEPLINAVLPGKQKGIFPVWPTTKTKCTAQILGTFTGLYNVMLAVYDGF